MALQEKKERERNEEEAEEEERREGREVSDLLRCEESSLRCAQWSLQ